MPLRRKLPASTIGAITKLCAGPCGGNRIQTSMGACGTCWRTLPHRLQNAYLAAKDGDCDSGPALERALAEIGAHLRKAAVR